MREFTLKEVCEMTGASRRAIQGYETLGLVSASGRNKYGHLLYDEIALGRIRNIKFYHDLGFTRRMTLVLLECTVEEKKRMIRERINFLNKEINRLQKMISEAENMI